MSWWPTKWTKKSTKFIDVILLEFSTFCNDTIDWLTIIADMYSNCKVLRNSLIQSEGGNIVSFVKTHLYSMYMNLTQTYDLAFRREFIYKKATGFDFQVVKNEVCIYMSNSE